MTVFVDQDIGLDKKRVRRQGGEWISESYPLQIPVDHRLTVHVYQPPSDVFELSEGYWLRPRSARARSYELEPIRIPMGLDELIDVPVYHPV